MRLHCKTDSNLPITGLERNGSYDERAGEKNKDDKDRRFIKRICFPGSIFAFIFFFFLFFDGNGFARRSWIFVKVARYVYIHA